MTWPPPPLAVLQALAECWPEGADVEKVVIDGTDPGWVVVTVWASEPGRLVGPKASIAADLRDRLGAAVPGRALEFRVLEGSGPIGEGDRPSERSVIGPARLVVVPNVVGMAVREARRAARLGGFELATADPDGTPISVYAQHIRWTVVAQRPASGVPAPVHSTIVVDVEERGGGGESGDREPRVPGPPGGLVQFEHAVAAWDLE